MDGMTSTPESVLFDSGSLFHEEMHSKNGYASQDISMTYFDINDIKRKNLNRIMEERGFTPTSLANKIGSHQSQISACLLGQRNIGNKTIDKISKELNIDRSEFFVTDEKVIPPNRNNHYVNPKFKQMYDNLDIIVESGLGEVIDSIDKNLTTFAHTVKITKEAKVKEDKIDTLMKMVTDLAEEVKSLSKGKSEQGGTKAVASGE